VVDAVTALDGKACSLDRSGIMDRVDFCPREADGCPGLRLDGALVDDGTPMSRQVESEGLACDCSVFPDQDVIRLVRLDACSGATDDIEIDDDIIEPG
jgi:hypothetical protein